jgi:DnaK suppressor protein
VSTKTAKGKAGAKAPKKKAPKKSGALAKKVAVKKSPPAKKAPIKKTAPAGKAQAKKPAGKPTAKGAVKKAVKPSAKAAPKPSTKKPPAKAPALATAKRAATSPKSVTLSNSSTLAKKPVATPAAALASPKSGPQSIASPTPAPRPVRTSRLQQLTVPGMAQSIASTAAKSSYSQLPALPVAPSPVYVAAKKDPKLANNWKRKTLEELTDADVLAMPDSEYMSTQQLAFFRRKLVQLRSEMLSNAGETTEHLREDTVIVPDPADRATIEEEHALELRTRDRERKLLKKVEQSINRIDSGDYGYCDETGEAIGVGRLLARPTASLSLEAQQRRELKQKMFGD